MDIETYLRILNSEVKYLRDQLADVRADVYYLKLPWYRKLMYWLKRQPRNVRELADRISWRLFWLKRGPRKVNSRRG